MSESPTKPQKNKSYGYKTEIYMLPNGFAILFDKTMYRSGGGYKQI